MAGEVETAVLMDDAERDEQIYTMRLAGVAIRTVARKFNVSVADVNAAVDRQMPRIDNAYRARCLSMDCAALEKLQGRFLAQALTGDVAAGHLVVKVAERRARALGLDAPLKLDVISIAAPPESSTQALRRIFEEVTALEPAEEPGHLRAGRTSSFPAQGDSRAAARRVSGMEHPTALDSRLRPP